MNSPLGLTHLPSTFMSSQSDDDKAIHLQTMARELGLLHESLCALKLAPSGQGGERMGSSKPGPKSPVPCEWASNLDLDWTRELHAVLVPVIAQVGSDHAVGKDMRAMCAWIQFNAWPIVVSEGYHDLYDTLSAAHYSVTKAVGSVTSTKLMTGAEIVSQLTRAGHTLSATHLRVWAQRGHLTVTKQGTRNLYSLEQVMDYLGV